MKEKGYFDDVLNFTFHIGENEYKCTTYHALLISDFENEQNDIEIKIPLESIKNQLNITFKKVFNNIYGINSKYDNKEIECQIAGVVNNHIITKNNYS